MLIQEIGIISEAVTYLQTRYYVGAVQERKRQFGGRLRGLQAVGVQVGLRVVVGESANRQRLQTAQEIVDFRGVRTRREWLAHEPKMIGGVAPKVEFIPSGADTQRLEGNVRQVQQ